MFLLLGCKKADTQESFVGTIWLTDIGANGKTDLVAIEFTGESSAIAYHTDEYLNKKTNREAGKYWWSGDTIIFDDVMVYWTISSPVYFTKGKMDNDFLVVETDLSYMGPYRFSRKK